MGTVRFERVKSSLTFRNPLAGFAAEEHTVEVRRDPLLGDTSVHNPYSVNKSAYVTKSDPGVLAQLAQPPPAGCVFCGAAAAERTACYTDDLVPGGRLRCGEALLVANLFPIGAYHPVIVLGAAHFLRPSEFSPRLLADGFTAARDFLRAVRGRDASAAFATVNANYLFTAGASLAHPHQQMLVTPVAYSYHARLHEAASRHHAAHGSSWFDDLVREERRLGERYAGARGRWHWMAAFSPMGMNEVTAVHEAEADLAALPDGDLADLGHGISRVLALYEEMGFMSFNYTLYSARAAAGEGGGRCVLKVVSRQNPSPLYRNDDYFLQKLLQSDVIVTLPEELAARLKAHF